MQSAAAFNGQIFYIIQQIAESWYYFRRFKMLQLHTVIALRVFALHRRTYLILYPFCMNRLNLKQSKTKNTVKPTPLAA